MTTCSGWNLTTGSSGSLIGAHHREALVSEVPLKPGSLSDLLALL